LPVFAPFFARFQPFSPVSLHFSSTPIKNPPFPIKNTPKTPQKPSKTPIKPPQKKPPSHALIQAPKAQLHANLAFASAGPGYKIGDGIVAYGPKKYQFLA
jgi:hypothetical protein